MRLAAINCLCKPAAIRFQESRMPGNPLVRFDEGRVGRTASVALSPTLPAKFFQARNLNPNPFTCPPIGKDSAPTRESATSMAYRVELMCSSLGALGFLGALRL